MAPNVHDSLIRKVVYVVFGNDKRWPLVAHTCQLLKGIRQPDELFFAKVSAQKGEPVPRCALR